MWTFIIDLKKKLMGMEKNAKRLVFENTLLGT